MKETMLSVMIVEKSTNFLNKHLSEDDNFTDTLVNHKKDNFCIFLQKAAFTTPKGTSACVVEHY